MRGAGLLLASPIGVLKPVVGELCVVKQEEKKMELDDLDFTGWILEKTICPFFTYVQILNENKKPRNLQIGPENVDKQAMQLSLVF